MSDFTKDPDAVLDYGHDWSEWLGTDTIDTSSWTATAGITIDSGNISVSSVGITAVWLSGGTAFDNYHLTNHVVTTGGREDDRTLIISCDDR